MSDTSRLLETHVPYATTYWKLLPRVDIDASDDLKLACETFCILVCYFPLPLVGWYQSSPQNWQQTNFEFLPSKIVYHSSRRHQSSWLVTQTLMSASLVCNMMMELYSAADQISHQHVFTSNFNLSLLSSYAKQHTTKKFILQIYHKSID